jgi:hypothetical protein
MKKKQAAKKSATKRSAKKSATKKRTTKKTPPPKKKRAAARPRRDPRALTEQQLRRELKLTAADRWSFCLAQGIPINDDQTFDLVAVVAWISARSAARHGGRGK